MAKEQAFNYKKIKQLAASTATAAFLLLAPQISHAQETDSPDNKDDIKTELIKGAHHNGFRKRIASEPWENDGTWFLAFEEGLVQKSPDQDVTLSPTLSLLSKLGEDPKLSSGELGVTIPPEEPLVSLQLQGLLPDELNYIQTPPENTKNFIKENNLDLGVQTATPKEYKAPNGGTVFIETRYQAGALQEWNDGSVNFVLSGDAAAKTGVVPKDVQLDTPVEDNDPAPNPAISAAIDSLSPPKPSVFTGGGPREVGAYILAHSGWDAWGVACGESRLGLAMVNAQGSGAEGYFQWIRKTAATAPGGPVRIGDLVSEVDGFNRMVKAGRRSEFRGYKTDCPKP